jgi:hypothetical protein
MSITKGNIVKGKATGSHGIVLAVTKDGKRAKVFVYGPDAEIWLPISRFTVEVSGLEQCYKCLGSGLYYMGGATVNGRYTGKTGICYGCEGKGEQSDDDRRRCHYYWHRKVEDGEEIESPMEANPQQPLDNAPLRALREHVSGKVESGEAEPIVEQPVKPSRPKIRSKKPKTAPAVSETPDEGRLIDCKGCGTLHRDDTMCPW